MAQKFLTDIDVSGKLIIDGSNFTSGSLLLEVQGTQGQLFSVTDSLTGDLFSVSDISGIPIINVNSSGLVTVDGNIHLGANEIGRDTHNFIDFSVDDHITFKTAQSTAVQIDSNQSLKIISGSLQISGDNTNFVTLTESGSGDFTIDAPDDIRIDAGGGDLVFRAAGTEFSRLKFNNPGLDIQSTETNSSIYLTPNGTGNVYASTDTFIVNATEGEEASILLRTDQGDDNGDDWYITNGTDGKLDFSNDISGSQVNMLTLTPHATASSSNATFAGDVGIGGVSATSKLSIGGNAITTLKPTAIISDETNGGSLTLRGQSPILCFDKTGTGNPKILTDGGLLEIKSGTLDSEGNVLMSLTGASGNATFAGQINSTTAHFTDNVYMSGGQLYLGTSGSSTDDSYRLYAASGQFVLASRESGTWTTRFDIDTSGNATFAGTIGASNFSGSSSGTNTGDQTLPTASSLGAVTLTGSQTISGSKTFTSNSNTFNGHLYYTAFDANGNHYPHFLDGSNNSGTTIKWRQYYGSNHKTHTWASDSSGNMLFTYQGGITAVGDVTVGGNLIVNGTTTTLNTTTVEVEDNILQLNTTQGTPDTATAATSGISIYRGDGVTQASLIFDDGDDTWDLTNKLNVAGPISISPPTSTGWQGLTIVGSGSSHTQGAVVLKSGTSDTPEARGQGVFMFNEGEDVTWYMGTRYQDADEWQLGRKTGTSIDTSAAATTQALIKVNSAGSATFAGGVTIKEETSTGTTTGKSLLTLHNDNSDLSQQQSWIDFKFTDTNANYTPQVRIGAQVGPDEDANSIDKEGAGSFVVYTSPIGNDNAGGGTGLAEAFRVSHNKNATFAGAVGVGVTGGSNAKLEVVATSGEVFRADSNNGAFRIVASQTGVNTQGILAHTGTLTCSSTATFSGKVVTTEVESSGTLLLDAAADITIDAGGQDIILSDDGTIFGTLSNSSGFQIRSRVNDADMLFRGVDGGTEFNALTLDMSAGGNATFAGTINSGAITTSGDIISSSALFRIKGAGDVEIHLDDDNNNLSSFVIKDGANNSIFNLAEAGNATFAGGLVIEGSIDSGASDMGYYQSTATNIVLKGDSAGRSGIFFESEKDGTNINDPSDYGFIQFHSYGYDNTSGEANNLVIGVANDSTDKIILQAPYNGGVLIGYKDATGGTGLTLSEVIHSNSSGYNNGNWNTAYTHSQAAHAPTNAEQNVQSDWDATSGDALILNKPTIPTDFVSAANGGTFSGDVTLEQDTSTVYDGTANQTGGLWVNNIYHEALNTFSQIRLGVSGGSGASSARIVATETGQAQSDLAFVLRDGSGYNEVLRLKGSNQNIGIGTASPSTKVHINALNSEPSLTISRDGNNMVSGQGVGSIVFPADYNGTPTNYGKIVTYANALSAVRGSIDFKVKSTSGSLLTGLTVYGTSSGTNVGIGTTSPGAKLQIAQNMTAGTTAAFTAPHLSLKATNSTNDTGFVGMTFATSDSDNYGWSWGALRTNGGMGDMVLRNHYNSTQGTEKMRILANGNVGIGTDSPNDILDIRKANSQLRLTDSDDNKFVQFSYSGGKLIIRNNSINTAVNQTTLTEDGKVGIGTTSPGANLEVAGDVLIDSGEYISWGGVGETSIEGSTASNKIQFRTGSTDRMIINNTGVGIGTTSPSSFNSRGRNLVVNSDGDTGITISANTSSSSTLLFADAYAGTGGTTTYRGSIEYDHADDSMAFSTATTEVLSLNSDQSATFTGAVIVKSTLIDNASVTSATTTTTVSSVAKATYTAAFFDYSIKNGTNVRAGTVVATHDGTNVEYTETSTVDLGDTSDVTLTVDISGADMRLRATTTSSTWTIKSLIRAI